MADITTKQIRNIVLLGHGGSGKTSVAEAALFLSKATDRLGKITDGNTVCDYDAEEIKRGFSLTLTMAPVLWKDTKINVIDAPGFFDFYGEVSAAMALADSALIVVGAVSGPVVGVEKAMNMCK